MSATVEGIAEIGFVAAGGATRLSHLHQRNPLRVLFPTPDPGEPALAAIVTTSGGIVASDRLRIAVGMGEGASAFVTASAAEKVYRSAGPTARIDQRLTLGTGARLEFLPPETILFDSARLRRHTTVELAGDALFLGGGILVFGRRARGEVFGCGFLHERWEIYRDGRLAWGDALHVDGDVAAVMADPACFAGAAACATLVLAPPGNPRGFINAARAVQGAAAAPGMRCGVTAVEGLLIARWLGPDPLALRRAYAELACHLREAAMGLAPRLPRLWHV